MLDKTLLNGLNVLETLATSDRPRGVSDLARELGISKTGMHRLLQTLVSRRYVTKDDEAGRYRLTMKLWEIGATTVSKADFKRISGSHLRILADITSESAHMTILDGSEVVYVDKIDGRMPLRTFSPIGGRAPAHCVATGKAQLAYQSDEYITGLGILKAFTKRTITSLNALRQHLLKVRANGYAVNQCEWRENICSIGAAVFDSSGRVVAGIGISGPVDRLKLGAQKKFGRLIAKTAVKISHDLGFQSHR